MYCQSKLADVKLGDETVPMRLATTLLTSSPSILLTPCVRSFLCVFLVSSMQESAEPTLCLSSSSFYLPSISTGQQEIDRYKESERERERDESERKNKRGARTKLLKRDTAISLLKETGRVSSQKYSSILYYKSKLADVKVGIFRVALSFDYSDLCRATQ